MPETKNHTKGYIWASEGALSVKALATKPELSLILRMRMVELWRKLIIINCLLTCTHVPLYTCAYIQSYIHTYNTKILLIPLIKK